MLTGTAVASSVTQESGGAGVRRPHLLQATSVTPMALYTPRLSAWPAASSTTEATQLPRGTSQRLNAVPCSWVCATNHATNALNWPTERVRHGSSVQ